MYYIACILVYQVLHSQKIPTKIALIPAMPLIALKRRFFPEWLAFSAINPKMAENITMARIVPIPKPVKYMVESKRLSNASVGNNPIK